MYFFKYQNEYIEIKINICIYEKFCDQIEKDTEQIKYVGL